MKNQLIPLSRCSNSPSEYQPALVPEGYRKQLSGEFNFRVDLVGWIHHLGALPIIETEQGLFVIQNASEEILAQWEDL